MCPILVTVTALLIKTVAVFTTTCRLTTRAIISIGAFALQTSLRQWLQLAVHRCCGCLDLRFSCNLALSEQCSMKVPVLPYTALFNAVVNQAVYAAQFEIYVLELNISVATDISPQGAKDVLKAFSVTFTGISNSQCACVVLLVLVWACSPSSSHNALYNLRPLLLRILRSMRLRK